MDTEDQILNDTKLITDIKKQRLKIQNRGWILKNIKQNQSQKLKINMEFVLTKFVFLKGY